MAALFTCTELMANSIPVADNDKGNPTGHSGFEPAYIGGKKGLPSRKVALEPAFRTGIKSSIHWSDCLRVPVRPYIRGMLAPTGAFASSDANAYGDWSVAFGTSTAYSAYSSAFGNSTANGQGSFAFGEAANAVGSYSFAGGFYATSNGDNSFAFGDGTYAGEAYGFVGGGSSSAGGWASTAFGYDSHANGENSFAAGTSTAFDLYSTAFGSSQALGEGSFASGYSYAGQPAATAMGASTAIGMYSSAFGSGTAKGNYASSFGLGSIARSYSSTVFGNFNYYGNNSISVDSLSWVATNPLFEIGNGASISARANALTVLKSGKIGISNAVPMASLDMGSAATQSDYHFPLFWYNDNNSSVWHGTKGGVLLDQFGLPNNTTLSFGTSSSNDGTFMIASKNTADNTSSSITSRFTVRGQSGNVGIGTTNPQEKLSVNGNILAKKVKVSVDAADWPDYVFGKDYQLMPLNKVEAFIKQNSHLPELLSAEQIGKKGVDLGDTQAALLKKIEELTLYMIETNKLLAEQQQKIDSLMAEQQKMKKKMGK